MLRSTNFEEFLHFYREDLKEELKKDNHVLQSGLILSLGNESKLKEETLEFLNELGEEKGDADILIYLHEYCEALINGGLANERPSPLDMLVLYNATRAQIEIGDLYQNLF